ncbi:MAG: hypothetical protein R2853_11140 [Thermomicrobiales bacterium]
MLDDAIRTYYDLGLEQERLESDGEGTPGVGAHAGCAGSVLPPAPARVLMSAMGQGPTPSGWRRAGYDVHLIDPALLHVEAEPALLG